MKHQIYKQRKGIELQQQITKSNQMKKYLLIFTIVISTLWLFFVVASLISLGNNRGDFIINLPTYEDTKEYFGTHTLEILQNGTYNIYKSTGDINVLYLGDNTIAMLFLIFAPIGYLLSIILISLRYGKLRPESVRKINAKALMEGYIQQDDYNYICNAMNEQTGKNAIEEIKREELNNEKNMN